MTPLVAVLVTTAVIALVSGVASMVAIACAVARRGLPVNWIFIRLLIPKYVTQYRALTIEESGRAGPLFYWFLISMNLALVCTIAALVLRAS
jgi:hypothetical protein